MKPLVEIYEVRPRDHMHNAGWDCGWYWETTPSSEPHGPYSSKLNAFRAAARAGYRIDWDQVA